MFQNSARYGLERDFKITLSLYMYEDLNWKREPKSVYR
jgi:hypothetical protein